MRNRFIHIIFLFVLAVTQSYGQISPGDLTTAHSELEGMSNCTLCHDIGKKVSNAKCLDCHKEIRSLINSNQGYHANRNVRNKDCFECHSDHHGRNFDMIRFDENSFNHDLTGYALEGKHEEVDCRKCHTPDNIANSDIRKRKGTYLGLDDACLSCHDDFHQKTLSNDCLSCHNMDAFKPVANFDHNETDYPLKGEHINVDCIECHKMTTRNGVKFQEFTDLAFSDCKACHNDPHNNQLKGECKQCHTETSFSRFTGKGRFNHNVTDFSLKGQHISIDCFTCHDRSSNPITIFQDNIDIAENNCVACHEDQHEGLYGTDCAKCHQESSFLALKDMDFFDHSITDYPLTGEHVDVDCTKCHLERFSTPIDFSACNNCHSDYHNGEFADNGISPDCVECHSLDNGFDYSLFTLERHQTTNFPLEGAHTATPCFACHISEDDERWTFVDLGSSCVDCHTDFHESFISTTFYPDQDCTTCHSNDAWNIVNFDHNITNWPLDGKHLDVDCRACHFEISENETIISQNFTNLDNQCASCHENVHEDAFAIDGITDCNRCHVTQSWFPEKFNHNSTAFPLEGRHAEISCAACHEISDDNGQKTVMYKLNKLECIDCHLQ
ncbi:MAG: cytochrome c family protein [Bacteroidia bacterium]|nr:cytochrome c family protein [Bacteroidia bacterium]NNJ81966.1 cytochrome c family protein [Flavobacteriaceae bacterium]NNK54734.1 cytochrome c family protein [Flavobacteriaceae bacterium]